MRSRGRKQPLQFDGAATELEFYLGGAYLDITMRLDEIEQHLKCCSQAEEEKRKMVLLVEEALRELRLCADVGSFALSKGHLEG